MYRFVASLLICVCLVLSSTSMIYAADSANWWQLVFAYSDNSLVLQQATPIAPTGKAITTPGLGGAPVTLTYDAEWQDQSGAVIARSSMVMPLGMRSAPAEDGPCTMVIPQSGLIVVRTTGPSPDQVPASLRLTSSAAPKIRQSDLTLPGAFSFQEKTVSVELSQARPMQGPIGVTKLKDTGPDNNRLVIVILSEGYTPTSLSSGAFVTHTNNVLSAFNSTIPWNVMFLGTNVYRIDVESNQDGADQDPVGTFKDTYFNSTFWGGGIERALVIDQVGYNRAISAADNLVGPGLWDELVVLVNSTKYGGTGGSISVISAHSAGPQVILHELGHTFADLADEYTDAYPGFPPGDHEANVDYDASGAALKWLVWVEPGTPLPTPDIPTWYNSVGTFEGARYLTSGIYRPSHNCLMRALGVPLDPVCKEAHLRSYFNRTSLIDNATPSTGSTSLVTYGGVDFSVNAIPFPGLSYQWKINSTILPETGATLNLTWEEFHQIGGQAGNNLILTISYPTSLMRLSLESEQFSWVLRPDCNGNGIADATDISTHTSDDLNHNNIPDECDQLICCEGTTGNINQSGGVDLSDLSILISYLTATPRPAIGCDNEANVNATAGIDLSDLSVLISYLVTTPVPELPACP
ncbi:MAG: hypothetical protein IPH75_07015 [bacterium]|nr:hypothetical protein [bacterium]